MDDPPTPIYLTVRIFEARVKKNVKADLSDQLFRLRTAAQTSDEKWLSNLQKAYPGFEMALLQTHQLRIFRSPRPGIIVLGSKPEPHVEVQVLAAYSEGDGKTFGTTLMPSVEYHQTRGAVPISLALQGFEVQEGMSYFFANQAMKLAAPNYVKFLRPGSLPQAFEADEIYLIPSFSVEAQKPSPLTFDERRSLEVQQGATKKVEPQWPASWLKDGTKGRVQVRIELSPNGQVAQAWVHHSTLPEANAAVLAAARQWEFPAALLANQTAPVSLFLTFDLQAASASLPASPAVKP